MQLSDEELISEFTEYMISRDLSDSAIKDYPFIMKLFAEFLGDSLCTVTKNELERYLKHLRSKSLKPTTIKKYFSVLSTFYEWAEYEDYINRNPVPPFIRHYLRTSKKQRDIRQRRQCPRDDQVIQFVHSIIDTRDKAIVVLLFKTGMRRHELAELDLDDVDLEEKIIHLKSTTKRTSEIVLFDEEAERVLRKWLTRREKILRGKKSEETALFINRTGGRLNPAAVSKVVQKYAQNIGLHDSKSKDLSKRFSAHCTRHWFSTRLDENGCPLSILKELRGDNREAGGAVHGYIHVSREKMREEYDRCIPKLGL